MVNIYQPTAEDGLNAHEIALYNDLMAYRSSLGLPSIPLSKALTATAGRHAVDIADNLGRPIPDQSPGEHRAHSWSDAPYNGKDSTTYNSMWKAPERLGTGYAGYGFEILITGTGTVVFGSPARTASVLLNGWKMSTGHNEVMTNQGPWQPYTWNAVGVSVYKNAAAIWFGREPDPTGSPSIDGFDPLRYLASHQDLMNAFGTNQQAAKDHYLNAGAHEGRSTTEFKPHQYLAGYTDLISAFGTDTTAAEMHYIMSGRFEGRTDTAFAADNYLASNADLLGAFGTNREAAAQHYITNGRFEGRSMTAFDARAYEAANPDVARSFGTDLAAATRHYIDNGYREGRRTTAAPAPAPAPVVKPSTSRDVFGDEFLSDSPLTGHAMPTHGISDFQSGDVLSAFEAPSTTAATPIQDPLTISAPALASWSFDTGSLLSGSELSGGFSWDSTSRSLAAGMITGA